MFLERDVCQYFAALKTGKRHPFYLFLIQIIGFCYKRDVCQLSRCLTLQRLIPLCPDGWFEAEATRLDPQKIREQESTSSQPPRIKNEGETDLHFDTEDGKKLNWTLQIAEVNKVLAPVSYLVDHNHRVVFDQDLNTGEDISSITNKTESETITMRRNRIVWVIDAYIEVTIEQGFTRPVAAPSPEP